MVYVVSGKLGSGKSYHCCRMAIDHLRKGGVVATNMNIDLEAISANYHRSLRPWQLVRVDAQSDPKQIPAGDLRGRGRRRVMVILDEALNWFQSTAGAAKDERKSTWGEWLRQSDKLGQDVYFVAQNFERAAKWIRELAQVALRVVNLGNIHIFRMPIGKWLHLQRLYCVVRMEVGTVSILNINTYLIEPRVWECYVTSELFGFEKPADGYIGSVAPAFKVPAWPFVLCFVVFAWGIWLYA